VKEVAATLGYDDQFYFSRVFKLATQVPPTQYRTLDSAARSAIKDRLTPVCDGATGSHKKCPGALPSNRPFPTVMDNRSRAIPFLVAND
jgi:hypothetical protein